MTDWESLYELVSAMHTALVSVAYGAVFAYFSMPFVKRKRHALAAGAAYFIMLTVLYWIPVMIGNVAVYGLSALAGLLVLCAFDRKRILQKIFLSMTYFSVRWLVMEIGNCVYVWMNKRCMEMPNFNGNAALQFRMFAITLAVDDLIDIVLLFTVAWIIKKAYKYRDGDMKKNEFALLMLPSMSGLVGYAMRKFYDYNYKADTGYALSEISTQFNLMSLCYGVISLGTIIVLIVLYQNIQEKQEEIRQKELLNAQIESMKHHIGKVERLYTEIRGLRHDMGNHITTLEALYETGERASAGAYMEALKQTLCASDSEIRSGNPVTDVILSERMQEAQEKGIVFVCDFKYPDSEKINAFDISVILNNALDNAIRAVEQIAGTDVCREIRVRSYTRNDIYLLEIENSFNEECKAQEKADKEHGYGLLNIKRVSQKYCGDMMIEQAGGVFKLSVMLVQ
ncbi:MAG: GHKL domain-containing protein [Lachnospiraceae bacterium]|nr:GHKL domain-containing protein [Lachnospiraceae bacterium]